MITQVEEMETEWKPGKGYFSLGSLSTNWQFGRQVARVTGLGFLVGWRG